MEDRDKCKIAYMDGSEPEGIYLMDQGWKDLAELRNMMKDVGSSNGARDGGAGKMPYQEITGEREFGVVPTRWRHRMRIGV
jgi:hypothetical protein